MVTGDAVTLIDKVTGTFTSTTLEAYKGVSQIYNVDVAMDTGRLVAKIGNSGAVARINPQGKALAQSRIGGMTLLNMGGDLLTNKILDRTFSGTTYNGSDRGLGYFGAFSVSDYKVKTGSHVDADGWSALTGVSWQSAASDDAGILGGIFFETGKGTYDGYNSFSTAPDVHSWGDTEYYGGGVFGRYHNKVAATETLARAM